MVGGAQILVAVATSLLVYEIGRRWLPTWSGLCAAVIVSLHPYSIWHDVHVNREILDALLAAAIMLLALAVLERPSAKLAAALGAVFGLAILGNVRLTLLPIAVGALFLVYWRWSMRTAIVLGTMLVVCAVVLAPWVIRNRVQVGCYALTTDSRALWEANNPLTLHTLQHDLWIDNVPVPRRSHRARRTPDDSIAAKGASRVWTSAPRSASTRTRCCVSGPIIPARRAGSRLRRA